MVVQTVDADRDPPPAGALLRQRYGLTPREVDVALLVLHGHGVKPIADQLALSANTVRTHLHHIFTKTRTHRQAELVGLLLSTHPQHSGRRR
jgi:DNA-binding CsgD family transcriptional regulator